MEEKTYLFYDIETSGLNKCFDQVLQFAAIRTDLDFNELEQHEFWIRLNPDIIPSPEAMITHRIPLEELKAGLPEMEAMKKIHVLLNTPGTISVGYNTLGFDDEFLRFSFYRNLLSPYTHQYAMGCGRMDLYPMTIMYYLFCREALEWPFLNGKLTLRLEHLSALNELTIGQAHNALVDVKACVALAKKLAAHQSMWNYVTRYFDKKTDLHRMNGLSPAFPKGDSRVKEALLMQGKLGVDQHYQAPVISLGQHQHYTNQTLWLRLDWPDLKKVTLDNIDEKTFVIRKRLGEPPFLLPTEQKYLKYLSEKRLALAHVHKTGLLENPSLFAAICDYHQHYQYPEVPNVDVDAALYLNEFPTSIEENLCREFHQAELERKNKLIERFSKNHLRTRALRALGRCNIRLLTDDQKVEFYDYLEQLKRAETAPVDYQGKRHLTTSEALTRLKAIHQNPLLDDQQRAVLDELERFLLDNFSVGCERNEQI